MGARVAPLLVHLDPVSVSQRARAESRNREVHLPPVSAYRWWGRRTLAINDALLAAAEQTLHRPLLVGDPFVGGGVIPLAAIARGHTVLAGDLNPWAVFGLTTLLALPDPDTITAAGQRLAARTEMLRHDAYRSGPATIAHTLRVACAPCTACRAPQRLFPFATVSLFRRRDRGEDGAWLACPRGHLFPGTTRQVLPCPQCGTPTDPTAGYLPRRMVTCSACGHRERLSDRGRLSWRVVLVERVVGKTRLLAIPTAEEVQQADGPRWQPARDLGAIEAGPESDVLLRHGFSRWTDLYPPRQRALTEALLAAIEDEPEAVQGALRLAVLGTTEMAGHLSRWDRYYLKSVEAMAGHRFNLTTLAVEPNVWGTAVSGRGTVLRRLGSLTRAAAWLTAHRRRVTVRQRDAARTGWPQDTFDLLLTDPPYHDDVAYDELSRPLRAWAGLSTAPLSGQADGSSTDYAATLHRIFTALRSTLRPDGHLVFSFANRHPEAWTALLSALQSAGYRCAGFTILHSENERDAVKRGVRSCALDLILDLTTAPVHTPHRPARIFHTAEEDFLHCVGEALLQLGTLTGDWQAALTAQLTGMPFLVSQRREAGVK